ncbi:hypothetical protein DMB65_04495 [Flavobacterium cheongpyeongense]|uniref:Uncharacterized protein n=1 Tax=Flavobacterium cheongpyeongense TaxID=2212651 RepID=A0A2V4BRX6_9FLAO|nr:hypothetical protein DMB65_04495 [Flavobacterium cheongpyeongense]
MPNPGTQGFPLRSGLENNILPFCNDSKKQNKQESNSKHHKQIKWKNNSFLLRLNSYIRPLF